MLPAGNETEAEMPLGKAAADREVSIVSNPAKGSDLPVTFVSMVILHEPSGTIASGRLHQYRAS